MSNGWIKLHRSLRENFLWSGEPFTKAQAWVDLLLFASFADRQIQIKGQVINLKRGQQARSEITLAKEWQWSRNKVRRFLELLKKQGMIVTEAGHLTTIITICNYDSFQQDDTAGDTTNGTACDTAGEHLTGHDIRIKERNNDNKRGDFIAPTIEQLFDYFIVLGCSQDQAMQHSKKMFNHYESNGWMVGKNKMANWASAATRWKERAKDFEKPQQQNKTWDEMFQDGVDF